MSRLQASVLTVLVVAALVVPFTLVGATALTDGDPAEGPEDDILEADRVEFRLTVHENASARWTFTYTRTLDNESERQQFEAFAEEFNENETDAFRDFREQARGLVDSGTEATDREMAATDFTKRAELGGDCVSLDDCGTIRMSFTWEEFARTDGDRVIVDDVFEGGLYLGPSRKIVFEHGPGLEFLSASPDTYTASGTELRDSASITWQGEYDFSDRRPRVVYLPEDAATPATGESTAPPSTDGTDTTGEPAEGASPPWLLLLGALVVVAGVGLALVWHRGGTGTLTAGGDGGDGGAAVATEPAVPDEELLSDEDRVVRLLEQNGGRMKQVDIVDETGWSKSKVSMLLSDMEDEGEISKLRVGRENIVSLAGHEPDAAGSPHEE